MELALYDSRNPLMGPLGERTIKYYSNLDEILLVGEGDFSFSAALANAFGSAFNMIATSLDSREKILKHYESACNTLERLQMLGATVLHGINVATMDQIPIINERLYHRIVYNFPHAGFWGSEDKKAVIKKHRRLVKSFFRTARTLLSRMGEIHVAHKEKHPYSKWKLEKQAAKCGLSLKDSEEFHREDYPGYVNRRGSGEDMGRTFPLGPCRTYRFILRPSIFQALHLPSIKPKWLISAAKAPLGVLPGVPGSILSMGNSSWASVKRRYEEMLEEEEVLHRPAVRQRTEGCYSLARESNRGAAVGLRIGYFEAAGYPGKMSLLNMTPAFPRLPSIAARESASIGNLPTTSLACVKGFRFAFL